MATDKDVVLYKIEKFIEHQAKHVTVDKVILYGSWARGNPTDLSDIDLAVFSADFGKNKLNELQLLSKIAWEVDETIEAIPYSLNSLQNPDPAKFVSEILKTGESVFERFSANRV